MSSAHDEGSTGRIISITSIVGATGNAGPANFAAAKAGLKVYSALALEVASRHITLIRLPRVSLKLNDRRPRLDYAVPHVGRIPLGTWARRLILLGL
ncbi:MAG: hypothetical protein CM1200mP41_30010 [Gammaproteobacteria bacterium]|nr:MAG: hypothetical protein CM1200mP41_30010 [Gammaproteobacteria bacterium]